MFPSFNLPLGTQIPKILLFIDHRHTNAKNVFVYLEFIVVAAV